MLSAAVFSCGEDVDEDSRSVQERILKAYINNNYPGTEPTESGIYIVESVPGEGKAPKDSSCVLVEFTISYLDGSYISYSSADLAKQLGTYSEGKYYGSQIWSVAGSESGIQEILKMMKEGGYIKAVLPPWALGYDTESDIYGTDGSAKIYEITLLEVIDNITAYEDSLLQEYTDLHYPGTDTTSAGFYFIKTKAAKVRILLQTRPM